MNERMNDPTTNAWIPEDGGGGNDGEWAWMVTTEID